jgi:hypothetical protein
MHRPVLLLTAAQMLGLVLALAAQIFMPSPLWLRQVFNLTVEQGQGLLIVFFLVCAIGLIVFEIWLPKPSDRSTVRPLEHFVPGARR